MVLNCAHFAQCARNDAELCSLLARANGINFTAQVLRAQRRGNFVSLLAHANGINFTLKHWRG